jgi:hypothetical protein
MGTGEPSLDCFRAFVHELGMDWDECQALLPVLTAWLLIKSVDLVRWALDRCPDRIQETNTSASRIAAAYFSDNLPLEVVWP